MKIETREPEGFKPVVVVLESPHEVSMFGIIVADHVARNSQWLGSVEIARKLSEGLRGR